MLNYLFYALQICLTSKAARILIEILSRKLSQDGRIIFAVQIKVIKTIIAIGTLFVVVMCAIQITFIIIIIIVCKLVYFTHSSGS